jgi:hypothetical protein
MLYAVEWALFSFTWHLYTFMLYAVEWALFTFPCVLSSYAWFFSDVPGAARTVAGVASAFWGTGCLRGIC